MTGDPQPTASRAPTAQAGRPDRDTAVEADLAGRAARGAAVTLLGQAARMVLQVGSIVVLARLLSPHDYGLLAGILVVVGVGEILRDFGLTTAAVQAPSLSRAQRDNLFWINVGIGLVLALIVFASAGQIADLFGRQQMVHVAQVMAILFVINGVATQYRAGLNRELRFGRLAFADLAGQVGALAVAVALAVGGAGYWALVAQQLAQVGLALVIVVLGARWRPGRPRRDVPMRQFLSLGFNLAVTQLVYYASNNIDTMTVGLRFSTDSLGVYNRGFQLLMTPLNALRSPATTVALPVLSRLQDEPDRAGGYLRRAQLALGYTIVPGLALAAGASGPLVALLLGPQWTRVGPVLSLLAIAGACQTLAYVGLWVYLSRGLGKQLLRYTLVTFVLQLACILVGSLWGLVGVAAGYAVAAVVEWPLSITWLSRRTPIPAGALLLAALRIVAVSAPVGVLAAVLSHALRSAPAVVAIAAAAAAAVAWIAVLSLASSRIRSDVAGVRDFARRMIRRSA